LPARQLLQEVLAIETGLGRERSIANGPRTIDIDILLYDDVVMAESDLQVPHPRMHERAFVLRPLLEIAPDATDPHTRERYAETAARARLERAVIVSPPPSGFR
jgi:2-amino-4-hydroxy-6-hydroxymethyldihydropteridine diphosphokinase